MSIPTISRVYVPVPGSVHVRETLTGTRDGTNAVFTSTFMPLAASETLTVNGAELFPDVDYTISGNTITFVTVTPDSASSAEPDLVLIDYDTIHYSVPISMTIAPRGSNVPTISNTVAPTAKTYNFVSMTIAPEAKSSDFISMTVAPTAKIYMGISRTVAPRSMTAAPSFPSIIPITPPTETPPLPPGPSQAPSGWVATPSLPIYDPRQDFKLTIQCILSDGTIYTLPYSTGVRHTQKESATCEWAVTTDADARELNPDGPGIWNGVLDDRAYDIVQRQFSLPAGLAAQLGLPAGVQSSKQIVGFSPTDGSPIIAFIPVAAPPAYVKFCAITGEYGGTPFAWPLGIPTRSGYTFTPGDPDDLEVWAGRGVMAVAYDDEQNMPFLTSSAAVPAQPAIPATPASPGYPAVPAQPAIPATPLKRVTSQAALQYIFNYLGLTACDVSGVTDWPMARIQLATGAKAISHISSSEKYGLKGGILGVTQGTWVEANDGVVCKDQNLTSAPVRYYKTTDQGIRRLGASSAASSTKNQCTAQRADDQGGLLAKISQTDAPYGDKYTAQWSSPAPITSLNIRIRSQQGGVLSNFMFYSGTGASGSPAIVLQNTPGNPVPPLSGAQTVQSVKFTFGALAGGPLTGVNAGVSNAAGGNYATGVPPPTSGSFVVEIRSSALDIYLDETVSVTVGVAASIMSGRGIRMMKIGPNPMICDVVTLTNWANYCLYPTCRKQVAWTFTGDLDPFLVAAVNVNIHDDQFDIDHLVWLKEVTNDIKPSWGGRETSWVGVEYVL